MFKPGEKIAVGAKLKLAAGLLFGQRAFNGPVYVNLDLTNRCNLNCVGCRYHGRAGRAYGRGGLGKPDLDPDLAAKLAAELSNMGTRYVVLAERRGANPAPSAA